MKNSGDLKMKYGNIKYGKFIDRPNRFIANVELGGKLEVCHVKNTGRCRELLLPGADVILEESDNPNRKTKYDLICVYKPNLGWVNIDSQAPNKVVAEWLVGQDYSYVKTEYKYGDSRLDFYMERNGEKYLMEVKGCTLEVDGIGYFPDAPSERAVKHLYELIKAVDDGYRCVVAFVIPMAGVLEVRPNMKTHPAFGHALDEARQAGVQVWYLPCVVTEDTLEIRSRADADK